MIARLGKADEHRPAPAGSIGRTAPGKARTAWRRLPNPAADRRRTALAIGGRGEHNRESTLAEPSPPRTFLSRERSRVQLPHAVAALRAPVLVPVLLGLQRQFPEESPPLSSPF